MKKWYESKTVWINVVALVAAILQGVYHKEVINPGTQVVVLSVINMVLRAITKHEINWNGDGE
jgi:hypothetical protein